MFSRQKTTPSEDKPNHLREPPDPCPGMLSCRLFILCKNHGKPVLIKANQHFRSHLACFKTH